MNIKKILPAVFKQGSQIIAATTTPLLQTGFVAQRFEIQSAPN